MVVALAVGAASLPGTAGAETGDSPPAAPAGEPVVAARVDPRPGTVALTFDDGPNPEWTPALLDLLDRLEVRATFFVVGFRARAHPEIVAETLRRGHSVQSHTYGHPDLTGLGEASIRAELERSVAVIRAATGVEPTCVRPPWGRSSSRVERVAADLGLRVVIWDDDSGDWEHQSSRVLISWANQDRWGDGDVILAHDSLGYLWAPILSEVVGAIRARGLEFDTICGHRRPPPPPFRWVPR